MLFKVVSLYACLQVGFGPVLILVGVGRLGASV